MMEALCSSETSVLTRSTQCHIPVDDILHRHLGENLKSDRHCSLHHRFHVKLHRIEPEPWRRDAELWFCHSTAPCCYAQAEILYLYLSVYKNSV
jgi:hypothetical protein